MSNTEIIATDPGWIILVKGLLVFATCVVLTLLAIWAERRIVARMQERPGPNRVGPLGLLQSLSDGVKLALKEDLIPAAADKIIFVLAPIISATTCFMAFAVALDLLPISAHALFSRPMVVSPKSEIIVDIESREALLSSDSLRKFKIQLGDRVLITRDSSVIKLSHIKPTLFTDRLVAKFKLPVEGWRGE